MEFARGQRKDDVMREHLACFLASGRTALDNGFAAVDDVAAVQAFCNGFGEDAIEGLAARWMDILPCPFTAEDAAAGYRYDISVVQAEFSRTQILDKPVSGRIFFEQAIRDNLDIGRPDQVGLIFSGVSSAPASGPRRGSSAPAS